MKKTSIKNKGKAKSLGVLDKIKSVFSCAGSIK